MADAFLSFSFLSSMHHTPFVLFSSFLLGSFILIMGTQFTHQYLISFLIFSFIQTDNFSTAPTNLCKNYCTRQKKKITAFLGWYRQKKLCCSIYILLSHSCSLKLIKKNLNWSPTLTRISVRQRQLKHRLWIM